MKYVFVVLFLFVLLVVLTFGAESQELPPTPPVVVLDRAYNTKVPETKESNKPTKTPEPYPVSISYPSSLQTSTWFSFILEFFNLEWR